MPFEIGRDEEMSDENAILAALDELSQSVLHGNQCSNDLMFDNYPVLGELGRITLYGRITCEVILAIHKLNGDELSSINAKDSVKNDFKSNEKVKAKEENAVNEIGIGAKIASELFMRCIKCYLVVNESLSESVKGQWSVLLMIVQANLPVDVLLTNGKS